MLCVCVSHFAMGRKKVCRQNGTLSLRCLGQCSCEKKTCLQVWSMYVSRGFAHKAYDSDWLSVSSFSSCVIIDHPCLKGRCMLGGEVHWGSPENLSDVTHPFLRFSFSSPGSLSERHTTHVFPQGFEIITTLIKLVCSSHFVTHAKM